MNIHFLRAYRTLNLLAKDDRGGITIFILPMFLGFILLTGIAMDFAHHEARRADLQSTCDRAVLAAASLTASSSEADIEKVVEEYVEKTRMFKDQPAGVQVRANIIGANVGRSVICGVNTRFDTTALTLVGLSEFNLGVVSKAREGAVQAQAAEISLVLDVSASMARDLTTNVNGQGTDRRLAVMKVAASNFITNIFSASEPGQVAVSLIPFSGHVNAGPFFDYLLQGNRVHNYSSCIEFEDIDFDNSLLPLQNSREQVPHFQYFFFEDLRGQTSEPYMPGEGANVEWGWCPTDPYPSNPAAAPDDNLNNAILPFSSDPDLLRTRINGLVGYDGTGTSMGIKWGLALLSDQNQPVISALTVGSDAPLPPSVAGRPLSNAPGVANKIMIVMSDGRARFQTRPASYETQADIDSFALDEANIKCCSRGQLYVTGDGLSNSESTLTTSLDRDLDQALRREHALAQCTQAKEMGIEVYTIAFDVDVSDSFFEEATLLLKRCALDLSLSDMTDQELLSFTPTNYLNAQGGAELNATLDLIFRQTVALQLFQ